jgi:hypothetical protein
MHFQTTYTHSIVLKAFRGLGVSMDKTILSVLIIFDLPLYKVLYTIILCLSIRFCSDFIFNSFLISFFVPVANECILFLSPTFAVQI